LLTWTDTKGEKTVLYDSEVVGGDTQDGGREGLHEISDSLKDFFYLDRLDVGQEGYITLYVKLDGETQGNDYQETLAKIKMNFAVEKIDDRVVVLTGTRIVKTGDNTQVLLFSGLALVSGLALLAVALNTMKKQRAEKGE